jgi:hypothetical protein
MSLELKISQEIKRYKVVNECWEYQGKLNQYGYGYFCSNGRQFKMHRVSFKYFKGKILKNLFICHSCNNPKCFNPEHLYAGTRINNEVDRLKKILLEHNYRHESTVHTSITKDNKIKLLKKCISYNMTMKDYVRCLIEKDLEL